MGKRMREYGVWLMGGALCFMALGVLMLGLLGLFREESISVRGQILAEPADDAALWAEDAERDWGIRDFGQPVRTVSAVYLTGRDEDGTYRQLIFQIEGKLTQQEMDGYVQSLWRACEKASGASNRRVSGWIYDDMEAARRQQEPLDYYMWKYSIGAENFHMGVYSTEMALGKPGGIVVEVRNL